MNETKKICKVNVTKAAEKRREFLKLALDNIDTIEKVHISKGNSKMGIIPSFSVLPIITCKNCKDCSGYCYASKGCFNFNDNIMNLAENTALVMKNPDRVYNEISAFLNNSTTIYRYFRWDVAGDIFSKEYYEMIIRIAGENPNTTFLAFTKNYELKNNDIESDFSIPDNLTIVFSQWSNNTINNPHNLPVAIVNIPGETNIPDNSFHCGGDCSNCLECWKAKNNTIRYFDLH